MRFTTRGALALALAGAMTLTACGEAPEEEPDEATGETDTDEATGETDTDEGDEETDGEGGGDAATEEVDYRACMITDQGGIDDGSFNETAYQGLVRAEEELGVEIDALESTSETDFEPNMQAFIQQDCDLIVPVGFLLAETTFAAAEENPDQDFAIVDYPNEEGLDNILGMTYETDQAAFLAGYAAAATTESGVVGTYGGQNIPTVTIFMDGLSEGIDYYNEENDADVELIGWDAEAQEGQFTGNFTSLADGRRVTETLLDNDADVIMPVAGPVGGGSAAAIEDRDEGGALIWVDTDGFETTDFGELILTSVEKQMDVSVYDAIEAGVNDEFEGGSYVGTLENEGVALAPFHDFEDQVPEGLADELDELEQSIIDGEIEVGGADDEG